MSISKTLMNSKIFTSILVFLFVFLISIAVHFPFIGYPQQFTPPEIHYLMQLENYFNHTDFKITQPPLPNLFYSLIVNLQFNNIFQENNTIHFNILLRIIPALFSSLVLPIITLILIKYDVPIFASFLCGAILAFEPSLCALNRFFHPNSFFHFFSSLTILIYKISELNISNNSRYYILKQVESILFAITACSDSSGVVLLIILTLQCSKNDQSKSKSGFKTQFLVFCKLFKYHLTYSAVLFIISTFIHIYLVSSPSNRNSAYSQFFSLIINILLPTNLSEIFTIQKLRNIHINNHIQILNNPAILLLIYIGIFLSMYYRETRFLIPAFVSFFLSFRFNQELLWKTPFLIILCILSLGLSIKNLSRPIASIILISAFCCSLLFYVILFSKSYGGQLVL